MWALYNSQLIKLKNLKKSMGFYEISDNSKVLSYRIFFLFYFFSLSGCIHIFQIAFFDIYKFRGIVEVVKMFSLLISRRT